MNRLGRTRFGARGGHVLPQAVIAEGALPGTAVLFPAVDDAERAVDDTVAAAVADVGLHVHGVEFGADNRPRRAAFEAAGPGAVLAHVGREEPGKGARILGRQRHRPLDEGHVPPGGGAELHGVVVRHAGEEEAVVGQLVPLLARDLTSLAADTKRRIGKKALGLGHQAFPSLLSCACPVLRLVSAAGRGQIALVAFLFD